MKLRQAVIVVSLAFATVCEAADNSGTGTPAVETEVAGFGDVSIIAGLRVWANRWDINYITREAFQTDPADPSTLMLRDVNATVASSQRIVPMPFLGIRMGNFLASVSYFPTTSYGDVDVLSDDIERDEVELNIGYYVLPSVVVSLSYKTGEQSKLTDLVADSTVKVSGIMLGASFSAPLSDRFSAYGNFAYGIGKSELKHFTFADGDDSLRGSYQIGEFGISYGLSPDFGGPFLKGALLTLGFRSWTLTFDDVPLGTYSPAAPATPIAIQKHDIRSSTDGIVLGFVGVF